MDSVNTRMDNVFKELQELKASLQYTQKDLDELKVTQAKQFEHGKITETDLGKIYESLQVMCEK